MKTEDKDKLKSLFQEVKLDEPSSGFESRLMEHIYIVEKKQNRIKNLKSYLALALGILGIIGIPAAIFRLLRFTNQLGYTDINTEFNFTLPHIQFNPGVISIACVVLLLLIVDTLIRRRIWEKKHKEE
ncbi:MAG: hypothetical protein LBV43_12545 [Prevotella sp.]|jgi:hypothetical protein|nr:hypothetical protein [Prevotella sp.]